MMLPIFPKQVEIWKRERPEPVELALDWACAIVEPDETFPNQRIVNWSEGERRVEMFRFWDQPRNPGMPMVEQSRRTVGGRTVITTSMFNGVKQRVELVWLSGQGHDVKYGVRLAFYACDEQTIADVLSRLVIRW
jgi:hypothetical protein